MTSRRPTKGSNLRRVMLREERHTLDQRFLWAWLDDAGTLHLEGQDFSARRLGW